MNYIVQRLDKITANDIKAFCVKQDAVDDWDAYSEVFFKRTVFTGGCHSWDKGGKKGGRSPLFIW